MTIQLSCGCGRRYQIEDEHAGKKTKCKACGATHVIPHPEPEEEIIAAVAEEDPEVITAVAADEEEVVTAVEVEEDDRKPARGREEGGKRKKPRRRRPARDEDGPLSRMYMAEAGGGTRRDSLRALPSRRGDDDSGWTIGGLHITAGVITGATMLLLGLLCMGLIAIFKNDEEVFLGPRIFIGAIVCTVVGIATLAKSIFFGEED